MSQSFLRNLPLARFEVDRDHAARERELLWDELWSDPSTRILPIFQGTGLLDEHGGLALLPIDAVPPWETRVYLGRSLSLTSPEPVGTPVVAVELTDARHLAEWDWANLRQMGTALSDRDAGLLTEAIAILNWHDSHRFSPRTGEATVPEKGGWVRRDPITGLEVFPRTDPAVIGGVTDAADRLLLGSNALWESNRYSLLAGFVEPGESFEAAVLREIHEESGLRVTDPVYLGSQPWPFPASVMVGFTARVEEDFAGEATPDGTEILDLRWFTRDELAGALDEIRLPGRTSIARAIIEEWFGGAIDDGRA
ncbi:NAD+ diphosphatase [Microbacteriaceae bacterium SG_E_30_P1]|uniref:NAD(+) diphosphatase n=1 Tax=Antiquaquibacter oligotrophicus TaxID=2880260 RepID=A0ABT6KL00_9MICO|nr:NAD(+) diphosphatase [Antiquaquibacter oligotrophicus]MDH6180431.1 NAD+ diphosphatase [Antiquaquibacter oligotrophicus]UDF13831.1 NAD(+) diphosphatase [Antiquaquibacter oligotrophicus]